MPRPHEVAAARRDPRLLRAVTERDLDPAWRTRGLCQSIDPETFFPAAAEPADAAVALCRGCDVQGPCLAWALDVGDCHGVWGATTPRERRAMLVAWRGGAIPTQRDPGQRDPCQRDAARRDPGQRDPARCGGVAHDVALDGVAVGPAVPGLAGLAAVLESVGAAGR